MPIAVSPGIYDREIDATATVQAVSTTEAGIAGVFAWGPVDKLVLLSNESELVSRFGKPSNLNAETFFAAANFLAYGNQLYVGRSADLANTASAIANTGSVANVFTQVVKNEDAIEGFTFSANVAFVAKYPGLLGNSLKVSTCDSNTAFKSTVSLVANSLISNTTAETFFTLPAASNTAIVRVSSSANIATSNASLIASLASIAVGDFVEVGNSSIGRQMMKVSAKSAVTTATNGAIYEASATISFDSTLNTVVNVTSQTISRSWEYANFIDKAPGTSFHMSSLNLSTKDELHVVVVDEDGAFTGNPGAVIETFSNLSRATDAKTENGSAAYYKTVINSVSRYIWVATENANAASNVAASVANSTNVLPVTFSFVGGTDGAAEDAVSLGAVTRTYDLFRNAEQIDVSHIISGKARSGATLTNYLINNIAEVRRDCVVYWSPEKEDVVNSSDPREDVVAFGNSVAVGSFSFGDDGYKYQYDKYNDVFRWIPLNGDIAGCAVRTDTLADPWFSIAGPARGQIKNCVKLAYNPSQADRDVLYKADINPVVSFPGQGTMLYGDKTHLGGASAFNRINVRRLFIVLRKAVTRSSRGFLFEFNDAFTRAQFRNLVEPFLRDVKGRRGIYDFRVVCDETNNTPEVIDRNEFIGSILVKPARSINFIQLDFVAVKTGVEFSEVQF